MSDDLVREVPQPLRSDRDALAFLVEAGEVLASSLDYRETLASIARLAVPRLADFIIIDLLQDDRVIQREHTLHVDAAKEAALRGLVRFSRIDTEDRTSPTAFVMASGEPMFIPEVPAFLDEEQYDPEQLEIIRRLEVKSLVSAPLVARGTVLGAITLGISERDQRYDRRHYDLVVELARRAAIAVENALLYGAAEEAREAAERSQLELQGLVKASDHVIVEFDSQGRYVSVAPTAAPKIYRPREQLIGRTVHEVFPPNIASSFADWIEWALDQQRSVDIEYPLEIDRRTVWFAGSVSPIGGDRVVWVVRDVTTRKVAEEALAESERRFRSTFDQAAVGISHIDLTGRFLRVNRRLAALLGYSRDELLRLTFRDITHPADRATHLVQSERLLAGEIDSYTIEKRYVRKNTEPVWVTVTGSLVRKESGDPDYFISVVQDIDDRKELEEQLIRAQKMEAVGRLAGGVAHEFNNALTTITGFSDLILRTLDEHDSLRPDIEEISRAAWRAAGVANRLMVFSSNQVAQPEVLDLGVVVASAQRMLAQLIGEDVELLVELDPEPTRVHADRRQLEQVVVNLAVNARDAMPTGGRLSIRTGIVRFDAEAGHRLGEIVAGEYVQLTLQDTGEGMTPEVQARIFDPFFTTKLAGKGTGLGLSIVYGIVRRAGGAVEVESAPGQGATFRIYLPRSTAAQRGLVAAGSMPSGTKRGERILLVEDDSGVRLLAERVMKRLGYDVCIASTAEEALKSLTEDPRPLDLLVTDLIMPGMSGRELASTLRALQPGLRVLFTSGYSSEQVLRRGMTQDDQSFLEKPFAPEELERALRRTLDR